MALLSRVFDWPASGHAYLSLLVIDLRTSDY
jgi:hypothetical protein